MGDHEKDGGGLDPLSGKGRRVSDGSGPDVMGAHPLLGTARFLTGATGVAGLPDDTIDEVAFAGRSNVGKSSLINALTRNGSLARTSRTPGRTQQINFFEIGDTRRPAGRLVDLPGYGYARAPKAEISNWSAFTRDYLVGRPNLKRVFLLIDARHGIKPLDEDLMHLLDEAGVAYQLVTTKTDKVPAPGHEDLRTGLLAALTRHPAGHPEILLTSAKKRSGIAALAAEIVKLIGT